MQPLPSVFPSNTHFFTHIHACAGRKAVWIDWQVSMAPVHYCLDAGGLPHPVSFPFTEHRVPQRSRFLLSVYFFFFIDLWRDVRLILPDAELLPVIDQIWPL